MRRRSLAVGTGLILALVAAAALRWSGGGRPLPTMHAPSIAPSPPGARAAAPAPVSAGAPAGGRADANDGSPAGDPLAALEDAARAWAAVDMEAIRAAMPDNLYWKMAAPTTDPELLRAREEERARWNVEYGKVLSNTATAEEIDAYYAEQQRLSEDYLEFLLHLAKHYGEVIPPRDAALLKLAGEMHLARLEEIPRRIAEAHERRAAHDALRRAWLEEQKAFEP
jgi:hypothetical protein